jgi:hypothetical protein
VPSFDGAKLDVDLTLPAGPAAGDGTSHPLVVMLPGFGNDKREWESTTDTGGGGDEWHWNSAWFAHHGFSVLTYTARRFQSKAASAAYEPDTPAGTSVDLSPPNSSGAIHLKIKSREFEARDTQCLAALVAAAHTDLDTSRVAVTGGSYGGGGESWLLASQARWTFPRSRTRACPCSTSGSAVPKYPWTDLGSSLAPNGHGDGCLGHRPLRVLDRPPRQPRRPGRPRRGREALLHERLLRARQRRRHVR